MTRMAQMNRALKQERDRRNSQTPGTYRYKERHGLGKPGLVSYIAQRTRDLIQQRVKLLGELNGNR